MRIKEGFQPHGRQVTVDGRSTDYWNAPRHYGPWAGGYFNGFGGGGLLQTLLVGSALGAGLGLGEDLVVGDTSTLADPAVVDDLVNNRQNKSKESA